MRYSVGASIGAAVAGGVLELTLEPFGAAVCVTPAGVDLAAGRAGRSRCDRRGERPGLADLERGLGRRLVQRLPQPALGRRLGEGQRVAGDGHVLHGHRLVNARTTYYVVEPSTRPATRAVRRTRSPTTPSIGWANLQWPPTLTHTISAVDRTDNVYGQVWIDGVTNDPGPTASLRAQLGFGPDGTDPARERAWTWIDAVVQRGRRGTTTSSSRPAPGAVGTSTTPIGTTTDGRDWCRPRRDRQRLQRGAGRLPDGRVER